MGRLLHHKHWWECLGTIPKVLRIFDQERLQWYGPLAGQERCLEFNNATLHTTHINQVFVESCIYYMAYLLYILYGILTVNRRGTLLLAHL